MKKIFFIITLIAASGLHLFAEKAKTEKGIMTLKLTSADFKEGQSIPARFTCDGDDISPQLQWENAPADTKSLALICDDPDAPGKTWVHWVLYNLPPDVTELSENIPKTEHLPDGAMQGINDFKKTSFGGPCPPPGKAHRYFFKLYALDTKLTLPAKTEKQDMLKAMENHVIAEGQLMGIYKRK